MPLQRHLAHTSITYVSHFQDLQFSSLHIGFYSLYFQNLFLSNFQLILVSYESTYFIALTTLGTLSLILLLTFLRSACIRFELNSSLLEKKCV